MLAGLQDELNVAVALSTLWAAVWPLGYTFKKAVRAAKREKSDFLAYRDRVGRTADFHAMRHRFITNLVKAGVQPQDAKQLARHSTITLALDRYPHVGLQDTAAAVGKSPSLTPAGSSTGSSRFR